MPYYPLDTTPRRGRVASSVESETDGRLNCHSHPWITTEAAHGYGLETAVNRTARLWRPLTSVVEVTSLCSKIAVPEPVHRPFSRRNGHEGQEVGYPAS